MFKYLLLNLKIVGKKRVVLNNNRSYQGFTFSNFTNTTSNTVFSFGDFSVTSNFDTDRPLHDGSKLKSYVKPVTLESLKLGVNESDIINNKLNNIVFNLDDSDINNYIRFGSANEFIRIMIEKIILTYPASLYINSQKNNDNTVESYRYNFISNSSSFRVPASVIDNKFGLIFTANNSDFNNGELRNLNLSYSKYVIWSENIDDTFKIINFTGATINDQYLYFSVEGNPFSFLNVTGGNVDAKFSFHIKPNNDEFEYFRESLPNYDRYIVSNRVVDGFSFMMKTPIMLDNDQIIFKDKVFIWKTTDGYNIDVDGSNYSRFVQALLNIGSYYDEIKTDIINRILSTSSIKAYDFTNEGKISKLLRIYGSEFDKLRLLINSLLYVNTVTYNKVNNTPDKLLINTVSNFGWEYQSILDEFNLTDSLFNIDNNERNRFTDLLPSEINTELWRRITINSNYFWKSKGTREAIDSMFKLIGIPNELISINEFIYLADKPINVSGTTLSEADFPNQKFPFDSDGYPIKIDETNSFYYQISGDSDGGRKYLDVYRKAGFNIRRILDNKKSWTNDDVIREHEDTNEYKVVDDRLVINTKEIEIALEASKGVEYDVYYSTLTDVSFINFMDIIIKSFVDARTHKITSFYPMLFNFYLKYIGDVDTNQYTFNELFNYLSMYDTYFNRFIEKLIPATVIQNNVGISIKNTIFTRQKFVYKRGVYIYNDTDFTVDSLPTLTYVDDTGLYENTFLGNDGSRFARKVL